ncbi:MAG: YwiC-like family protein [Nitrospinae bacterium]|nr:YwiC-like family protein [Nitrospinota bacterium]
MAFEIGKPIMPKEHGLWVWVLLPVSVGAACGGGNFSKAVPLLFTVFFGFLALTPARIVYKNAKRTAEQEPNIAIWCAVYSAAAIASGAYAEFSQPQLVPALALMATGFYLAVRASLGGYQRSAWFEFGGLAALSAGSFPGAYAVSGKIAMGDVGVWALTLLFMLDRSIESRRLVRLGGFLPVLARREPLLMGRLKPVLASNLFISFLTLLFALALADKLHVPLELAVMFVPGFLLTLFYLFRAPTSPRQVGFSELFLAVGFGAGFSVIFIALT